MVAACWSWFLPFLLLPALIHSQFYTGLGSTTYNQGGYRRSRYQKYYSNFRQNPLYQTSTTTKRPAVASLASQYADKCGIRPSGYRPDQRQRQGRIIVPDSRSSGAAAPPAGSFPWLASLFLRRPSGEAYFMCAATLITPTVLVSAAHCFNEKWEDSSWYVRLGDNYIAKKDPSEQTFQVDLILRHQQFLPLSRPGGDGRNDIALLRIRPRKGKVVEFSSYVAPACLPKKSNRVSTFRGNHCEIAGWGMQEYNNTSSYPTSIRAAKIKVGSVRTSKCNSLYGRDVPKTGKFCAGGKVDACQVIDCRSAKIGDDIVGRLVLIRKILEAPLCVNTVGDTILSGSSVVEKGAGCTQDFTRRSRATSPGSKKVCSSLRTRT